MWMPGTVTQCQFCHCASYDPFRFASVGRVVSPRHGCRSRDANVGFFGSRMRKKSGVFVEPRSRATPATGRGGTSDGRPFRRDVMLKHNLRVPYKPSCGRMTSIESLDTLPLKLRVVAAVARVLFMMPATRALRGSNTHYTLFLNAREGSCAGCDTRC